VLDATTVTVEDNGPANDTSTPGTNPPIGFPADADAVAEHRHANPAADRILTARPSHPPNSGR